MTPLAETESLQDQPGFLAELDEFERELQEFNSRSRPAALPTPRRESDDETLDEWPSPQSLPAFKPNELAEDREDTSVPTAILRRAAVVLVFILLMSVGAAGAAMIFHDRVAHIVQGWKAQ